MEQTTPRKSCIKTYKERLRPTLAQERALDEVLWRCRDLYNAGLEQRITAWQRRHASLSRYDQEAELKDLRAEFPAYAAIHSHVLQDVLARLDRTYQAFFRRIQQGEKAGFPRFKGRSRYHSFTFKEYGNGARLDNGFLVLSKIGRIGVHGSRPIEGTPKTVTICKEADGWYLALSSAEAPLHPLPATGQETGIDLGLESFATRADGARICTPAYYRKAEAYLRRCQRRVARRKNGSHRRAKALILLAKAHQHIARQRRDFHHQEAHKLVTQYDTIYDAVRHDLLRRPAGPQHGPEPFPGEVDRRRRVERVPGYPHFQGCKRREASDGGESRVYQSGVFTLWRDRAERLVRPLASLPRVRDQPAS